MGARRGNLFCRIKNRTRAHYYAKSYHSRFEFVVCYEGFSIDISLALCVASNGGCDCLLYPTLNNYPHASIIIGGEPCTAAVIFGASAEAGKLNEQRIVLPCAFERMYPKDSSEKWLRKEMFKNIGKELGEDEIWL